MVIVGIIGKTNVGKTTFFNAATLLNAKISTHPFTTKVPGRGIAYVQMPCVCKEFRVKDNPKNSACIEGWRFLPIELIDLPGLIEGAHMGRGLGTQFLRVAMISDALLHVVDASGSIDKEGRLCEPGKGDPLRDYHETENELVLWFKGFIDARRKRIMRLMRSKKWDLAKSMGSIFSGAKIPELIISECLKESDLATKEFSSWNDDDTLKFAASLRRRAKPTLIVANKMDLPPAEEKYQELVRQFGERFVIPCSADAELALRRAERSGLVKYVPGHEKFEITDDRRLTERQRAALSYVSQRIFERWLRTGVQFALNFAIFKLLRMNVVYPVQDEKRLTDGHANVLPDAHLVPPNSTARDLAKLVHTELAKHFIYAIDARTGLRLPENYLLCDRDVIKIVAARKRSK